MKKIILLIFFFAMFLFTSMAYAKVKIYTGEGLFAVVDETLDYAKK